MHELLADALNVGARHLLRHGMACGKREGAWPLNVPAPGFASQRRTTPPRHIMAGFSAGMGQLNCRNDALLFNEAGDVRQWRQMGIVPQTQTTGRDPTFRRNGRGFDHHQSHATHGSAAEVYQVPIVGHPIDCPVLAHRRHGNAVGKSHIANGQGSQQVDRRTCRLLLKMTVAGKANGLGALCLGHVAIPL